MPTLTDFASDRYPLRCSRLPEFVACPWKSVMQFLDIYSRDGGSAAQTGSAAHKAIHVYHSRGKEVDKAIAAMKATRAEFPLADFAEAERLFRFYVEDERNSQAKVIHAEFLVHGEIDKGIVLEGTADQFREEEDGTWKTYDVKTSRFAGPQIRDTHAFQLAAYSFLASKRFKRPVLPGAVIMLRGYEKGRDKVFFPYSLTTEDVNRMMRMVADRVREVRAGCLVAVPCELCNYCLGHTLCMQKLRGYESGA